MHSKTWFERAIFFSWYCGIRDCAYCYMSTQPEENKGKIARRTTESILAEIILCKKLGWKLGFFSGGIGAYTHEDFLEVLKLLHKVYGEKIWLNIGPLSKEELEDFKPYTEGVVGSIETVNKRVHDNVCPSKPIEPYLDMFKYAKELGLKNAMTIILGLGETIADFEELKKTIKKYDIVKIHFYGLNPQKGTIFENAQPPSTEYQAEWIKKTREAFPEMDIQCGIWKDRVDRIPILLKAGANSISKFPAVKKFGSEEAKAIEAGARTALRTFEGTLTKMPEVDWDKEVDDLDIDKELKEKIKKKLNQYIKTMEKSSN